MWVSGHSLTVLYQKLRHVLCFYDRGINVYIIDLSGFYIRVSIVISFYISGLDYSECSHMVIYITQVTCSYIPIIHYIGLFIYVHMLVSRLKSDCD